MLFYTLLYLLGGLITYIICYFQAIKGDQLAISVEFYLFLVIMFLWPVFPVIWILFGSFYALKNSLDYVEDKFWNGGK